MKMKHSKGPWWVEPEEASEHRGLVICAEDVILATITPAEDGPGLDEIDHGNAQLIAAAPDLLAALEDARETLDSFLIGKIPEEHRIAELARVLGLMNQATAKATGA